MVNLVATVFCLVRIFSRFHEPCETVRLFSVRVEYRCRDIRNFKVHYKTWIFITVFETVRTAEEFKMGRVTFACFELGLCFVSFAIFAI